MSDLRRHFHINPTAVAAVALRNYFTRTQAQHVGAVPCVLWRPWLNRQLFSSLLSKIIKISIDGGGTLRRYCAIMSTVVMPEVQRALGNP